MSRSLQILLATIAAVLVTVDAIWSGLAGFTLDMPAYGRLALLVLALTAAGLFYDHVRRERALSAMLLGAAFLIAMAAAASALNMMLLTVAGPRMDDSLAAADRMLGFDWPALMTLAARHPAIGAVLRLAYQSVLPQLALLIVIAGFQQRNDMIGRLCLAVTLGALGCIAIWTIAPSFGAFSVYALPPGTFAHLSPVLDAGYARDLEKLLADGPGLISPIATKGLIGFPSYHAVLALLAAWYGLRLKGLRLMLPVLNVLVLLATPIEGGHHMVDVAAGVPVAAAVIWAAAALARRLEGLRPGVEKGRDRGLAGPAICLGERTA